MANKPKGLVVLAALAAIVMLAAGVCALHWVNAISLRGTVMRSDYLWLETTGETLDLPAQFGRERMHALYQDEGKAYALHISDPWKDGSIIHIEGALLRLNQTVGEVNVRVGLIPEGNAQQIILLNTQMVRRHDYAVQHGEDDHCGFAAAVSAGCLDDGTQYSVVLVDESDGRRKAYDAEMTVSLIDGGLAFRRGSVPQEEAQDDE